LSHRAEMVAVTGVLGSGLRSLFLMELDRSITKILGLAKSSIRLDTPENVKRHSHMVFWL